MFVFKGSYPQSPLPASELHTYSHKLPEVTHWGRTREVGHSSDMEPDLGKCSLDMEKAEGFKVQNLAQLSRKHRALSLYTSRLPQRRDLLAGTS